MISVIQLKRELFAVGEKLSSSHIFQGIMIIYALVCYRWLSRRENFESFKKVSNLMSAVHASVNGPDLFQLS